MPEHRRKFSPQFKAEAVQMVISTGKPIAEVARLRMENEFPKKAAAFFARTHP